MTANDRTPSRGAHHTDRNKNRGRGRGRGRGSNRGRGTKPRPNSSPNAEDIIRGQSIPTTTNSAKPISDTNEVVSSRNVYPATAKHRGAGSGTAHAIGGNGATCLPGYTLKQIDRSMQACSSSQTTAPSGRGCGSGYGRRNTHGWSCKTTMVFGSSNISRTSERSDVCVGTSGVSSHGANGEIKQARNQHKRKNKQQYGTGIGRDDGGRAQRWRADGSGTKWSNGAGTNSSRVAGTNLSESEASSSDTEDENDLPGFYYDRDTGKHFLITDANRAMFAAKKKARRQEAKRQRLDVQAASQPTPSVRQVMLSSKRITHPLSSANVVDIRGGGAYARRWQAETGVRMKGQSRGMESRTICELARQSAACTTPLHLSVPTSGTFFQRRAVFDFSSDSENGHRGDYLCSIGRLNKVEVLRLNINGQCKQFCFDRGHPRSTVSSLQFQKSIDTESGADSPPPLAYIESGVPQMGARLCIQRFSSLGTTGVIQYAQELTESNHFSASGGFWYMDWPLHTAHTFIAGGSSLGYDDPIITIDVGSGRGVVSGRVRSSTAKSAKKGVVPTEMTCLRATHTAQKVFTGYRNGSVYVHDLREPSHKRPRNAPIDSYSSKKEVVLEKKMASVSSIHVMKDDVHVLISRLGRGGLRMYDQRMWGAPVVTYDKHVNTHDYSLVPTVDSSESVICCVGSDAVLRIWDCQSPHPLAEKSFAAGKRPAESTWPMCSLYYTVTTTTSAVNRGKSRQVYMATEA